MHDIAVGILLSLSTLLGVESRPEVPEDWIINTDWQQTTEGYFLFSATNRRIVETCQSNPSYYIEFPSTIHSSSQVSIDGQIIASTSSSDFQHTRGFYGVLIVPCAQLASAIGPLEWQVKSYTRYFAWFKYFPKVTKQYPMANVFNETLNITAASILLALSILYAVLFSGRIPKQKLVLLICSNFFTSFYFAFNTAEFFGLSISMLLAHKIADAGLWIGLMCFIHVLYLDKLVPLWMNTAYKICVLVALIIILMASTGDSIQLGTSVPFPLTVLLSGYAIFQLLKKNALRSRKESIQLIGLSISFFTYWHDILVVTGVIDSFPMLSVGVSGSYLFILLSVNESINSTYAERDELRRLTQQANEELHRAQDQLVKSEKMAVMGRAVARIAHELNTPIYSARSAMQNIQTQTDRFLNVLDKDRQKDIAARTEQYNRDLTKMSEVLQISLTRAAELVRNFKEISVDQINVKKKTFDLLHYIKTSLTTLEESLTRRRIEVNLAGDNVILHHDPSLFYQLINNLVSNVEKYAYDSKGGVIDIRVKDLPNEISLSLSDYGKGIPQKDLPKIFDAFFTTGGGTRGLGLGLNIVYSIVVHKLQGEIVCDSKEGKGTCFTVHIPKNQIMDTGVE